MNSTDTIITIVGSISALSGVMIYIGKRVIDKTLDVGLEKYKSTLSKDLESHKAELTQKTEEFKANLQIIGLEHQIRYSRLHEQRGQSIKELYDLLIDLEDKLEYFTTIFQGPDWTTDQEREKEAVESHKKLSNYFRRNQIYYPEAICSLINELLPTSWKIIVDMSVAKLTGVNAFTGPEKVLAKKEWQAANSRVTSEIVVAKNKIQKEFKALLGVE